jgi:ankyrin repeat protein
MQEQHKVLNAALLEAAKTGNVEDVEKLIEEGADVNARGNIRSTPLHYAAKKGNTAVVKILLQNYADVNLKNKKRYTALHYAVDKGHIPVIMVLLKHDKIDINAQDQFGRTPLHLAVDSSVAIIDILVLYGANINAADNSGHAVLHYPIRNNNIAAMRALINHGANIYNDYGERDILDRMAHRSSGEMIDMILGHGANIGGNSHKWIEALKRPPIINNNIGRS